MAKVRLSKNELAKQRNQLKLYQKLLPSLDLKRRQLTVELTKAERELADLRRSVSELEKAIGEELPMTAFSEIDVDGLVTVEALEIGEENVVGTRLPALERIDCKVADYSLLNKPAWVDVLVARLRDAAEQRARVRVGEERVKRLEHAVRRTTQRVNLFEKILIPGANEAIRQIMIYMGDQERSAVANSKLTKAKLKRQQKAMLGAAS